MYCNSLLATTVRSLQSLYVNVTERDERPHIRDNKLCLEKNLTSIVLQEIFVFYS